MKLQSKDTLGGYRIELLSESESELLLLKEIEKMYAIKNEEILKDIKNSLLKFRKSS